MTIVARFFPNGEFTQGVDTSLRRHQSRAEKLSAKLIGIKSAFAVQKEICAEIDHEMMSAQTWEGTTFQTDYANYTTLQNHYKTWYYYCEPKDSGITPYVIDSEYNPIRYSYLAGASPHLGLSDARILKKPQNTDSSVGRKKCLTMTKSMARNIRNAGFLLQEKYGKDQLSFLTLTLPNVSEDSLKRIAQNWGKVVHTFLMWLRKRLEKLEIPFEYVYCTEIQTKRKSKYGHTALHLHMVFVGRLYRGRWGVTPIQCRKAWLRAIKPLCGEDKFNTSAVENLQRVKSSASGYLSKYLSKGSDIGDGDSTADALFGVVIHWGGMSRITSARIRCATRRFASSSTKQSFLYSLSKGLHRGYQFASIRYVKTGFIQTNKSDVPEEAKGIYVAVGCLTRPTLSGGLCALAKELGEYEYSYSVSSKWKHLKRQGRKYVYDL